MLFNWGDFSDETAKLEVPCHSRYGMIKISPKYFVAALKMTDKQKFVIQASIIIYLENT